MKLYLKNTEYFDQGHVSRICYTSFFSSKSYCINSEHEPCVPGRNGYKDVSKCRFVITQVSFCQLVPGVLKISMFLSLFVDENITLRFALDYMVAMYEIAKSYLLNTN